MGLKEEFDNLCKLTRGLNIYKVESWDKVDQAYKDFMKRLEHADSYMKEHNNG